MESIHHQESKTQSRYCSTVLPLFGFGPIQLDGYSARLAINPGQEFLRIDLYAFHQRFRTTLRRTPKTEDWHSDFAGILRVGFRRYHLGATLRYDGRVAIYARPLHLYAVEPTLLEVLQP